MDKKSLYQYKDLCAEIERLEKRLERLNKTTYVHDSVRASNPEFPYEEVRVHIEGIKDNSKHKSRLSAILAKRKSRAEGLKLEIEDFISSIDDSRVRMIVEDRFIHGKSWLEISRRLGSLHESYARKLLERYFDEL